MIKLRKNSLDRIDAFPVETMNLQLSERQSTASFTVGPDAPEIGVGDWMQDDREPGAGIVWRVRSVDTAYDKNTRTVQLEHMVNALKDRIMFGEVTAQTMGGGTTCTAKQAVTYILDRCPQWTLGSMPNSLGNVSNAYSFNGDDCLSALQTVSGSLADCWWEYDFSVYPFKLSIRKRSEAVGTEMRMSRNISTAKMTVDKSRMYTRIYPIGNNNMHISGNYIQKNADVYGVICKVQTDQSKETETELRRWAQELLDTHAEPSVTVSISGIDLSRETGEPLDRITLGALCRVPLPGYNTTITETVTKLSWSDKIKDPYRVSVTLANVQEDVATIVNRLTESSSATSGRAGRTSAKKAQKDNAWLDDQEDYIQLIARKTFGTDNKSQVASLKVDGDGIHGTVTRTEKRVTTAESNIEQNAEQIKLTVKKGNVISEINQSAEKIKIKASKIELDGEVVAKILTGRRITVGTIKTTDISWSRCVITSNDDDAFNFQGRRAMWVHKTVINDPVLSTSRKFVYAVNGNISNLQTVEGMILTGGTVAQRYFLMG